jgi:hypothetical protein
MILFFGNWNAFILWASSSLFTLWAVMAAARTTRARTHYQAKRRAIASQLLSLCMEIYADNISATLRGDTYDQKERG